MAVEHAYSVSLIGPPQADGEYIALRRAGGAEEVLHLHEYARIYAMPGLYEHVVQELLACRSPQVAVEGLGRALAARGIDPPALTLLDVGAGTGLAGELARELGVRDIVGLDFLEQARAAAQRDRPGVYAAYLVADLADPATDLLRALRAHRPQALIAAGALGGTHMPPAALERALELLPAGAPVVFTIHERWTATDEPGGFRGALATLMRAGRLRLLERTRFRHRLSTSGEPIFYELFVATTPV